VTLDQTQFYLILWLFSPLRVPRPLSLTVAARLCCGSNTIMLIQRELQEPRPKAERVPGEVFANPVMQSAPKIRRGHAPAVGARLLHPNEESYAHRLHASLAA
jgi:hypothetical protein